MIDIRDERIYETYKDKNSVLDGDWVSLKSSNLSELLQNDIIRIKITDTLTSKKLFDQHIILEKIEKNGNKLKISIDDDNDDNINTLYLIYVNELSKKIEFGLQTISYKLATFKMSKCNFNTLCKCKTCFVTLWKKINLPTINKKNKLKDIPTYMLKPVIPNKQKEKILSNDPFLNELQFVLQQKIKSVPETRRKSVINIEKQKIKSVPETRRKSVINIKKLNGVSNSTKKINNVLIKELATLQKINNTI
jgi:hypothetical protein